MNSSFKFAKMLFRGLLAKIHTLKTFAKASIAMVGTAKSRLQEGGREVQAGLPPRRVPTPTGLWTSSDELDVFEKEIRSQQHAIKSCKFALHQSWLTALAKRRCYSRYTQHSLLIDPTSFCQKSRISCTKSPHLDYIHRILR